MKKMFLALVLAGSFFPVSAFAHEAYVLDHDYFFKTIESPPSTHAFDAMENAENVRLTLTIAVIVSFFLALNFFFRLTVAGERFNAFFEKFSRFGPIVLRLSIAVALLFSAFQADFLGPELLTSSLPYPAIIRTVLFASGVMIALGLFTEIAALATLIVFVIGFMTFGSYTLTYLNYFGEFVVLLLFGMRVFSLDSYIFGKLRHFKKFEKYETVIIRIFYGFALMFTAYTVKFLHPELTTTVVVDYHLTQFHWLFPSDPHLVVLGAGIVEMVLGLFIIIGFEMRLMILVSLFYLTLSLFYFGESVWPHLLLYGISFMLLVEPEIFTLDHIFFRHHREEEKWWLRIFKSHRVHGKSVNVIE